MRRVPWERLILSSLAIILTCAFLLLTGGGLFPSWVLDRFWRLNGPIGIKVTSHEKKEMVKHADPNIVIVRIDTPSLRKLRGDKTRIDRSVYAALIDRLASMEAKLVGLDVTFDEPGGRDEDSALLDAVRRYGKVVSNCFLANNENLSKIWVTGRAFFHEVSRGEGLADHVLDKDMFVRKTQLYYSRVDLTPRINFALALYLAKIEASPSDIRLLGNNLIIPGRSFPLVIPVNSRGAVIIPFLGGTDSEFQSPLASFSVTDVLEGKIATSSISQKIVLVGGTAEEFRDSFHTPFSIKGDMPGVEIHAHVLRALLENEFLSEISGFSWWIILLIVSCFFANLFRSLGIEGGAILLGVCSLASVFFSILSFSFKSTFMNPLDLVFSFSTGWISAISVRAAFLQSEKAKISNLFKQYVSPTLLQELLANPGAISLGGSRRCAVILFADNRGFTSLCEERKPEQIITFLNSYFTEVTQVIFQNGGILNKYIGDGLMAFFGVPVFHGDEPERAVTAAIKMKLALAKLKETYCEAGIDFPIEDIGIGINGGDVVAGNVGSEFHLEYTLLGDSVNLAARLESLASRGEIFVSKWVQEKLPIDRFEFVSHGLVKVKGRKCEVEAFEVRGFCRSNRQLT
ncbi:adenylate/guanylate cyclase domain-containing protein [bacterium]|nr:adenylate/guanylate cyclase domain-containing protein [bacterium]